MNPISHAELLQLKRWNTPTIYNGWEQITTRDPAGDAFNLEETRDFMPQMGPMIGYAVTVVIGPSNKAHREANVDAWNDYRRYVAGVPGPKIVCVQDLDKPRTVGSFWGEVNSNMHRALGCVGTIVDGAIRDVDEMTNAGFKALARRLCVGHAHGFIVIAPDEQSGILEAARFMDANECETVIPAARDAAGRTSAELLEQLNEAGRRFGENARRKCSREGEW